MSNNPNTVDVEKMLVLGAGQLGMAVLEHLIPARNLRTSSPLTVMVSQTSLTTPTPTEEVSIARLRAKGADVIPFDLATSSQGELAQFFAPFHTVINCTGFVAGPGTQTKITKAIFDADVRRYFPWQFGVDYDVVGKGSGQPVFDEQFDVRTLLRSQSKTEWVIISTGMFTSFLFEPAFGIVDLKSQIVRGLGSWDTQVTVTTPEDIGRLTTDIVLEEPRIKNEVVFVAGDTLSYGRLADVVEEVSGRRFDRVLLTPDILAADLAKSPDDVMARYRIAFAKGDGMWWDKSNTYNAEHGIPTTDTKAWFTDNYGRLSAENAAPEN